MNPSNMAGLPANVAGFFFCPEETQEEKGSKRWIGT